MNPLTMKLNSKAISRISGKVTCESSVLAEKGLTEKPPSDFERRRDKGLYLEAKSWYLHLMEKGKCPVIWKRELKEVAQDTQ